MTGERLQRARAVFEKLVDLPADQRGPILAEDCRGDEQLRTFVEELLANDDRGMGEFLANPAYVSEADLPAEQVDWVPRRIGHYEVVRVVGEGGMGTVYEAQQENPRRRVALKVIRPGLAASQALWRFQQEADLLGQLQHPGIAQIHEAGMANVTTATGASARQPFFAMELIRGGTLHEHAQHARLGTRERLELVARVCDAVQHAHQKGVIHRDLKPGNILVDQSGQPKILDFGVARATDADMQTLTLQTGVGQLIGTIPYMSPEQVTGDSRQLDTRSDVYALGVILYELLSGSVPHDVRHLSIPDAARKVREEEPQRLGSIDRALRGEVEVIVTRALEKDRTRRYQSASELAVDIRRYLRGEAIEAKRDSALYMLRKTVARYRGWVAAGGLLFALLAAFGIVSFIQANRNQQLADGLTTALSASNIERGRLFARAGHLPGAEDLIWREHLRNPRSSHSYWALWELYAHNSCLATFATHAGALRDIAFSTDGRTFVACGDDANVTIWDAETFQPVATLAGHGGTVSSVACSPDGQWIASASEDGTAAIWSAGTHERMHTLRGHEGAVNTVAFAGEAGPLVTGGNDATLRVWDAASGECLNVLKEHRSRIVAACYNGDIGQLATLSEDGTIKLWQDLSGPSIATLPGHEHAANESLAFSPDGRRLAWGGHDTRLINVWNLDTPPFMDTLGEATNGNVRFLAFTPDGNALISSGWYRVEQWDLATHRCRLVAGHEAQGGAMSPDGRVLVLGWGAGGIRVTGILPDAGEIRLGGNSNVGVASISPDGRLVACGDNTDHVRLWEIAMGRLLARLPSKTWRWSSAHFHPFGKILATGGADGLVQLWELETGTLMSSIEGVHVTTGQSLSFSPDGCMMAATYPDQTVRILDVETGQVLATLPSLSSEVLGVKFGPRGRLIATTHRGRAVGLWTQTGEHVRTLATEQAPWTVGFSPDGTKLAVGCWGYQFQVWDLETGELDLCVRESKAVVWGVAYRPTDANILATCAGDGSVRLWDLREPRNVLTLEPFGGSDALSVSFTPDGKTLVAAGFDGSLCVWDLEYYDRHIAGNLEYQIGRFREELGEGIQTEQLRAWASDVLRRPWPRIGPHAQSAGSQPTRGTGTPGVDPDVITAWGNVSTSTDR